MLKYVPDYLRFFCKVGIYGLVYKFSLKNTVWLHHNFCWILLLCCLDWRLPWTKDEGRTRPCSSTIEKRGKTSATSRRLMWSTQFLKFLVCVPTWVQFWKHFYEKFLHNLKFLQWIRVFRAGFPDTDVSTGTVKVHEGLVLQTKYSDSLIKLRAKIGNKVRHNFFEHSAKCLIHFHFP